MNHVDFQADRRLFMRQSAAWAATGCAAPLAMSLAASSAVAATAATDYKALVCIFLHGGNDAFNTVLATDEPSWAAYTSTRNQQPESIALRKGVAPDRAQLPGSPAWLGGVLPIAPVTAQEGRSFALHPMLGDAAALFANKRLAIVANVGPLCGPLAKSDYVKGQKDRPRKLFSHNDQQSTWMAMAPEGATVGWGGRLADAIASGNGSSMFTAISLSGHAVWLSGDSVRQYQLAQTGPIRVGGAGAKTGQLRVYDSDVVGAALERVVSRTRNGHLLSADLADVTRRSITYERLLSVALPGAEAFGAPSMLNYRNLAGGAQFNPLAQQLQTVARTIAAQQVLGLKRQVFFVSLGGFDTHNTQNKSHADLLARLNHALSYFDQALGQMGMHNQVTTFTASDFGRSFTSNGDGTDHGWGAHHIVMGGAVKGGDIIGDFPVLGRKNMANNDFDSSPDQLTNGVLLPRLSVDQYGASLGRWFGVGDNDLTGIFPNLVNFGSGRFLPLMKA